MIAGSAPLNPAKLEEGYYPLEHFKKLPPFMANFIQEGESIEPTTRLPFYQYIAPTEKDPE